MKMRNSILAVFAMMFIHAINANAQNTDTIPTKDGFFQTTKEKNNKPFVIPAPNEVDVKFYKRIWRDIDLKDSENELLNIPGATLIEGVIEGLKTGVISAYSPVDDSFSKKYTIKEALSSLTDSVLIAKFDKNGDQVGSKMVLNDFNPENITKFRIKEDIFFNQQRGKIETRIIGIAPLKKVNAGDQVDIILGEQPAFWLYFPQARYVLVNMDASDSDKGITDLSLDDIFLQRRFKSTIIRESKPNGERIADYATTDEEKKIEAQKIEDKIKKYKSSTWTLPVNPVKEEPKAEKKEKKEPSTNKSKSKIKTK